MKVFILEEVKSFFNKEDLLTLKQDFIKYKTQKLTPNYFGKDVGYDHAYTPRKVLLNKVNHLHLRPANKPWPMHLITSKRTSDYHLVYCQGMIETDHYLFIAILKPNAHDLAKQSKIMHNIGIAAEEFRLRY